MIARRFPLFVSVLLLAAPLVAQEFDDVQIKTEKISDGIYMLIGRGGNIALSVGEESTFMVDDQYAPLTEKIRAAVAGVSELPVEFVINTHWHGDHTGGNEKLGEAGAIIVAHENVRKRLSTEQFMKFFDRTVPPMPKAALPVITFTRDVKFHLNGEEIDIFHVAAAHTDGDAIVHFKKANVIHMGDVFFNGSYPFIDLSAGGSIDGVIAAVDSVLPMIDDDTKIIPGHGPLTDKVGALAYRRMLAGVRERIAALVDAGTSLEEVIASNPTAEFDEEWGQGFMKPDKFTEIVYTSIAGEGKE
jgi:glyoxylase-like metal-dependent hydrolase (beta-lactamase superfamily II)